MSDLISRQAAIDELCADCQGKCIPCEAWPCDEIKVIQNMPSAQNDIAEAVKYIKATQEYLTDIGETWYADYLGDAIELLVGERRGEEDE